MNLGETVVYVKQKGFPPSKIAGTILLCMAFLVTIFQAVRSEADK